MNQLILVYYPHQSLLVVTETMTTSPCFTDIHVLSATFCFYLSDHYNIRKRLLLQLKSRESQWVDRQHRDSASAFSSFQCDGLAKLLWPLWTLPEDTLIVPLCVCLCLPLSHNWEVEPLRPVCQGETQLHQTGEGFFLQCDIFTSERLFVCNTGVFLGAYSTCPTQQQQTAWVCTCKSFALDQSGNWRHLSLQYQCASCAVLNLYLLLAVSKWLNTCIMIMFLPIDVCVL